MRSLAFRVRGWIYFSPSLAGRDRGALAARDIAVQTKRAMIRGFPREIASVAQLAELWFCKPGVVGSSPTASSAQGEVRGQTSEVSECDMPVANWRLTSGV